MVAFIIFDTEYIADKGLLEKGFNGWRNREVIQIAALKVNDNLMVIDSLNLYIKPHKHKIISPYFTKLTGITNTFISEVGEDFPKAYKKFRTFADNYTCYSHGWSLNQANDGDGEVLRETMAYYDFKDNNPPQYKNIAFWFREQYSKKNINITKQASGEIAILLGRQHELKQLNIKPHNALYDVYSILVGLKYLGFCQKEY